MVAQSFPTSGFERYSLSDWQREQQAKPTCAAAIPYLAKGSPKPPPADLLDGFPELHRPVLHEVLALAAKGKLHTTDDGIILLVRDPDFHSEPVHHLHPHRWPHPHLRPHDDAPLGPRHLLRSCFVPPRHVAYSKNARTLFLVDRYGRQRAFGFAGALCAKHGKPRAKPSDGPSSS